MKLEHLLVRLLSLLEASFFCTRSYRLPREEEKKKTPSNINVYVLALPPSLLQALFTLALSLPSFQLNMDNWFIGKSSMMDHLLLVPSPAFLLPCVTKMVLHQIHLALFHYSLKKKKKKPTQKAPLATFSHSHSNWLCRLRLFDWSPRFCLLKSCLFPQRRLLCLSHAPSLPGGVTWRAFDYKKQR